MSKITAMFQMIVGLLSRSTELVKFVGAKSLAVIQTACIITFVITGTGLTITAGWLWLKAAASIALALPALPLVLFGILLVMTVAGAVIVAKRLKDTELDDIWGLIQCYLLSGIAIVWEAIVVVIKILITKRAQ